MNWTLKNFSADGVRKNWVLIFSYIMIYVGILVFHGFFGGFWSIVGQGWLLAGCFLLIFFIYYTFINNTESQLKRSWFWILCSILISTAGVLIRLPGYWIKLSPSTTFFQWDFIFILSAIFLWMGLISYPLQRRQNATQLRSLFDFILSIFCFAILLYAIMVRPFYYVFRGEEWKIASFIIVIADMISIIISIYLFLRCDVHALSQTQLWLFCGIITYAISNLIYALKVLGASSPIGMIQYNGIENLGRVLGNTFFMMGAVSQINDSTKWPGPLARLLKGFVFRLQTYLPLILGFLLCLFIFLDSQINMLAFWGTVIVALGLIARQGLQVGEYEMQKYADLVNRIAEPTFICDAQGHLQLANPALVKLAGSSSPLDLQQYSVLSLFLPSEGIGKALKTGLGLDGWSGEVMLQTLNGQQTPVMLSLRPLSSGETGKLAVAGSAHDLSLQKQQQLALQKAYEQINDDRTELEKMNVQLEKLVSKKTEDLTLAYQKLEEQNRTLQQLDRMKSDFVGLVSHELRAPLTNIRGGIELLQRVRALPKPVSENLLLVQAETQRLSRFVETILDLTALDAGRMPFYPTPISMNKIRDTLNHLVTYLPGSERLDWNIPENLPFVMADDQALTSVIFHLVDNAIKYAPEGKIEISAGVEQNRRLWVKVKDEGPGIAEEALPHLFKRFYRASSDSQVVYGHGLGLYIVMRMLEAMNGEIGACNNSDRGACFTFWLPLVQEKEGTDV